MQTRAAHDDALRALARISLTVLAAGCIEDPSVADPGLVAPLTPDAAADATADGFADAAPDALPDPVPDAAIFVDAFGDADAAHDAAVDVDAVVADATVDAEPDPESPCDRLAFSNSEAFWACCEEHGFPPGPCTPWGPPMPPAFVAERGWA